MEQASLYENIVSMQCTKLAPHLAALYRAGDVKVVHFYAGGG